MGSSKIKVAVCVFSVGRFELLKKSIESINQQQDVDLEIFIFSTNELEFSSFKVKEFFKVDRNISRSRNKAIQRTKNYSFVYFLDEDVLFPGKNYLKSIIEAKTLKSGLYGGSYISSEDCSFWGKSYNFVCQLWLNKAKLKAKDYLLGGNFFIYRGAEKMSLVLFDESLAFGGEEIPFLEKNRSNAVEIMYNSKYSCIHKAHHTFKDFIRRAICQIKHKSAESTESSLFSDFCLFWNTSGSLTQKCGAFIFIFIQKVYLLKVWNNGKY